MKRAGTSLSKEEIEDKDPKIKTILFTLCYFHSVMLERRKFGLIVWNRSYPFSVGDLRDSSIVPNNYMENNYSSGKIPWDDLTNDTNRLMDIKTYSITIKFCSRTFFGSDDTSKVSEVINN